MKTTIENVNSVKKRLIVEIEAHEIDKRIDDAYRKLGRTAKIKGFRPGKAPRKILERYYGEGLLEDVKQSIIKETLPSALEETSIIPINIPQVENEILKAGEGYTYTAVMEVRPEFELKDYQGIEVKKEKYHVTEGDVEKQIQAIREAGADLKPLQEDRGIKEGDYAVLDYEGFEGQKAIQGIGSKNFVVKIGSNRSYPGFEDALIGHRPGDTLDIKVDFDKGYFHSALAGKGVTFKTDIKEVKLPELPELNDEFAKGLGGNFSGLGELRKKLKEDLVAKEEKRVDNELKERILAKISGSVDFELPESLIEPEISSSIENIRQNLIRAGSSLEKSGLDEARLREDMRPAAEKKVKGLLILGEIAKQNNLTVEESDITKGFEEVSRGTGHDPVELRKYYEANNLMDAFRQTLLKEKTLNFLVEHATVVECESSEISDN